MLSTGEQTLALMSVRVAAGRLGVSYSTLKRWVHLGSVRTTTTSGGHHRISDVEIDRLLATTPERVRSKPLPADDDALAGLSARNRLRGLVEEVRVDGLLAQVRMRVGTQMLTAVITADAIQDLNLKRGDEAIAVIKSTEVMIARTAAAAIVPRRMRKRRRAGAGD
jgi:molybdopterin-binding protein